MKRVLVLALAISVLVPSGLRADDPKKEADKLTDKQQRQAQLDKDREALREHVRKLRDAERAQAEKARERRQNRAVQPGQDSNPPDQPQASGKAGEQVPQAQPQTQQPRSGAAIYDNLSYYPPGPVYPPVPIHSLFNTPNWYGINPGFAPYPSAGYAHGGAQGAPSSTMPPPAPPVFGFQVMPPGFPVTVPYSPGFYPPLNAPAPAAAAAAAQQPQAAEADNK